MSLRAGATGARAAKGLVLLHGRGSSAREILTLGERLGMADLALAAPEAPGRSWWPTSFLAPSAEVEPYLAAGIEAVEGAVRELEAEGLPRSAIAVCGFSQGACLGMEYAARRGAGLAGLFAFSGGLAGTGDASGGAEEALYGYGPKRFDYSSDLHGVAIDLSCHERDPHIPLARVEKSREVLRALGAEVTARIYPGQGHAILSEDFEALSAGLAALPRT